MYLSMLNSNVVFPLCRDVAAYLHRKEKYEFDRIHYVVSAQINSIHHLKKLIIFMIVDCTMS